MTKTYVVSGCGLKFDAALWPVPPNVEIHFYFQCMREPQVYKTRTILDKLMLDVGMFPDRVALAGEMIPSHFVWSHASEQPPSGVFRRQTGNLALDLTGTDQHHPVALSHVVKTLAGDRRSTTAIHWIVREEEGPADLSALDCLYPTRLRNGVYDSEESGHAPLPDDVLERLQQRVASTQPVPLASAGLGPVAGWPGVRRRANTR
jgi:hypothetical protein